MIDTVDRALMDTVHWHFLDKKNLHFMWAQFCRSIINLLRLIDLTHVIYFISWIIHCCEILLMMWEMRRLFISLQTRHM